MWGGWRLESPDTHAVTIPLKNRHTHPLRCFPGTRHRFHLGSTQQQSSDMADHRRMGRCCFFFMSESEDEWCVITGQRCTRSGHGKLRHTVRHRDKTWPDFFFFFFKRSGAFLQQSSWRNLSQWIHPSVPPGLPHTSGTIVSCSRGTSRSVAALRTAYVFSPRFCFVDPVLTMSGRQEATITKGGLSYHLTLQVAELFFRFC